MLRAIAGSYLPPALGRSEGPRLTVMRRVGKFQARVYNGTPDPFLAFFDGRFGKANYSEWGRDHTTGVPPP